MELTREQPGDPTTRIIRAYAAGSITTNLETVTRSVVISAGAVGDWPPDRAAAIAAADVAALVALEPEVILIGTGPRLVFPDHAALAPARSARIGVEVMDTAAACRTYNLLVNDGRRVVAALIML